MSSSSVEQLLQEADELVQMYEYQKSVDKLHEAYQLSPNNTDVLDKLAEVLLEVGQIEDAQNISFYRLQQLSSRNDSFEPFRSLFSGYRP